MASNTLRVVGDFIEFNGFRVARLLRAAPTTEIEKFRKKLANIETSEKPDFVPK
jgi:hypothetical protein